MLRISDVLEETLTRNPFIQFGFQTSIYNLTKLAKHLQPLVAIRSKKNVGLSALVMALSRHQRRIAKLSVSTVDFAIDSLTTHAGLSTVTFPKSPQVHQGLEKFYAAVQRKGGYLSMTEGTSQTTVISDSILLPLLNQYVPVKPLFVHEKLCSLGIGFQKEYIEVPGLIYVILQQLMLQHVNVIEISSTFTELTVYIDRSDMKIAFDTLQYLFKGR